MDADPYATAAHIAAVLGVPVGTIRRWATEDDWAQTSNTRRPVLYRYQDACDSYERRRVAA